MPYQIVKEKDYFKLKNIKTGVFVNKKFKSKQSAINMAKVWMRYRKEKPVVKGNKILKKN